MSKSTEGYKILAEIIPVTRCSIICEQEQTTQPFCGAEAFQMSWRAFTPLRYHSLQALATVPRKRNRQINAKFVGSVRVYDCSWKTKAEKSKLSSAAWPWSISWKQAILIDGALDEDGGILQREDTDQDVLVQVKYAAANHCYYDGLRPVGGSRVLLRRAAGFVLKLAEPI